MNHSNMHYYVIRTNSVRIFCCLHKYVHVFLQQISNLIITALRRRKMRIFTKLFQDIES